MPINAKVCLIRLALRMGIELGLLSQEQFERVSNQMVEDISSEDLLLLSHIMGRAASILEVDAQETKVRAA